MVGVSSPVLEPRGRQWTAGRRRRPARITPSHADWGIPLTGQVLALGL
jgi:hypothetical protein